MTSNQINDYVESIELEHEFTPPRCPNKNAFIESFFSIYETQFLQVRYFKTLKDAYEKTEEFIKFYNNERVHSSLNYKTPNEFYDLTRRNLF